MFATPAYAQTVGAAGPAAVDPTLAVIVQFAPFALIILVFYFLILRPQSQRAKAQAAKIAAVKKGDSVVTAGGVLGKVTKVEEQYAEVEIAPTVKIRVVKATLVEVTPLGGAKPAND